MSYASLEDIAAEFKDLTITDSTAISIEKVMQWISDADAEIHTRLSGLYQIPITGKEAKAVLRMVAIFLVKHRILAILEVKSGDKKTDQGGDSNYRKNAIELLDSLVSGKITLRDAILVNGKYLGDFTENVFLPGVKQW